MIALVALKVMLATTKYSLIRHTNLRAQVSEKNESPKGLSFGWQRASLLGAFFNGVLLFGLGISIFLQSIERFIALQREFLSSIQCLISGFRANKMCFKASKTRKWSSLSAVLGWGSISSVYYFSTVSANNTSSRSSTDEGFRTCP